MTKKITLLIIICTLSTILLSLSATKVDAFPNMYANSPKSIFVLPPINYSTAADAKEFLSCTITKPLAESGYYVFPIDVTNDFLKAEGLYDTELIDDEIILQFNKLTGADAVLIPELIYWDKVYYVIGGHVKVGVRYTLKSAYTGEVLWTYEGMLTVDTTNNQDTGGGGIGLILSLAATAIKTASQDYFPIAEMVNNKIFKNIPFGSYHKKFQMDQTSYVYYPRKNAEFMDLASQARPSEAQLKQKAFVERTTTLNDSSTVSGDVTKMLKPIADVRSKMYDYVILKDSRVIFGEVLRNKNNQIKILKGTTLITIPKTSIDRIEDFEEKDITEEIYSAKYGRLNFNNFDKFEDIK